MYICICNAVTDSDIRRAADDGVRNLRQLKARTGCSGNCGQCEEMAEAVLREALAQRSPFLSIVATPQVA